MSDLSKSRATHMSTPLNTGDIEFHLRNEEVKKPKDAKEGKPYYVRFPVQLASADEKGHRYKSVGLPDVQPRADKPAKKLDPSTKFKTQSHAGGY